MDAQLAAQLAQVNGQPLELRYKELRTVRTPQGLGTIYGYHVVDGRNWFIVSPSDFESLKMDSRVQITDQVR